MKLRCLIPRIGILAPRNGTAHHNTRIVGLGAQVDAAPGERMVVGARKMGIGL
jgi:hypothetical protein